ncbi:MAG TPA: hypothetical protein VMY05_10970 [Acidobacteriota bacterium]|nr:hypothetical protein [Acidobacteriota bacterium]
MAKALIREPEDLYRAALLLGPDDESTAAEVCLQAHYLAAEAASKGHMPARYVAATSLDRYLVLSGRLQLYGTQYLKDDAGKYRLYPYDTATTDSTRAEWGVAPLDSLIARVGALTESATD